MRVKNVTAADDAVGVVDENVEEHVATVAQETLPSEAILEVRLVSRIPVLVQRATDDESDLRTVNQQDEQRTPANLSVDS